MLQPKALTKRSFLEPFIISTIFTLLYLSTFSGSPDYDPIRNLIVSQEIQERGIPTYFDSAYWQHPPILNYIIAVTGIFLGIDIYLAGKIIILAFSFLLIFVFYNFCLELKGRNFARVAVAILGTTPVIWVWSNRIMHEIPMTFFFTATLYFLYKSIKYANNNYFYISGVFLGLLLLTKSQAVVVVPVIITYLLLEKGKCVVSDKKTIKMIIIMFAIGGFIYSPYTIFRTVNGAPSFFGEATFNQLLTGKAAWSPTGDISVPFYYYITDIFDIISFSVLALIAGAFYFYKNKYDASMRLPVVWISFSYLILSIFAHKEYRFMVIAIPAMVIISVYGLENIAERFKDRKSFYAISAILIILLVCHNMFILEKKPISYWPSEWNMWDDLKELNNSVISTDFTRYSTNYMAYGTVKLMTGKYSDILPSDPNNGVQFALMYNTPYLLYEGKHEYSYPFIKMKYFEECNCTLYKIDENVLFGNKTMIKTTSLGKALNGVNIYLLDLKGNMVYRSKSNIHGEVFIPTENYEGILVADKICYSPVQTFIKIDNKTLNVCNLKQQVDVLGIPQNYLDCKLQENIDLPKRGCFDNDYKASRF